MNKKDLNETTSSVGQGSFERGLISVLRATSIIALAVGATGSLFFMFRAGQQTPRLLLILFTIWVLAPFAALLWAARASKRWSALTRGTLYYVTLIVALSSLAIYGEWVNVRPPGSANAFLFVAIPPLSLLFIAIILPLAALISGKFSQRGDGH